MTRGGKRPGAGRPRTGNEKIAVPLPVRVTRGELANIKRAAAAIDTPVSRFVRDTLALQSAEVLRTAADVAAGTAVWRRNKRR